MRRFESIPLCILLASSATAAWSAQVDGLAKVQSYAPDYFVQFQVNTALDMIDHVPGFSLDNGTSLRGYSGTPGNVLVNGRRTASKTDSLWEVLGRIPASGVLRIDVINGGASGIDMQGLATVANVLLKPIDLTSASTTVSSYIERGGVFHPRVEGNYSLKRQDKSIDVYLGRGTDPDMSQGPGRRTTWYPGRPQPAEMTFETRGVSDSKSLKVGYAQDLLGGQLRWNGTANPSTYRFRAQYDGDTRSQVVNENDGIELEEGIGFTRALGRAAMDLKALYRKSDNGYVSTLSSGGESSRYRSDTTALEQIIAGQLNWQPQGDVALRGGFERAVNTNDSGSAYQANGDSIALPSSDVRVREIRTESQLSSTWQFNRSTSAEAGLRIERSSLSQRGDAQGPRTFVYSKPRLLLSSSPMTSLHLRFRLEREVSQLNFSDFVSSIGLLDKTVTAGNPDLVPAKTWLSAGTLEYHFWDKGAATLTYTHSSISDVIDRVPIRTATSVYDAAGNIGNGSGDSVTGLLNVPTDKLHIPQGAVKLTTTWASSSVTDPVTLTPRRLSGEQPLAWTAEFSQELPRHRSAWGVSVNNGWSNESWQVSQRDTSSGGGWVKAYINYRPAPKTTVALELNNLANRVSTFGRTHYAGDRQAGSIDFFERNVADSQSFAVLSLRQDW